MYRRASAWLIGAGILACAAAFVLQTQDEPARAPLTAPGAAVTALRPSWFDAAPLMPHSTGAPGQESEPPLAGRSGRIVDLGGLDVAHYIALREGAARLGDLKAVYEVYQAVALCANIDQPLPDTQEPADRDQLAQTLARQRALCANISPAQVQERMRYLRQAADGGNAEAQIDYYMEGPAGAATSPDDPAFKQWSQEAMAYLKAAGDRCNHFALSLLSTVYDAGNIVERDPGLVMAYGVAAARARGVDKTPEQWQRQFGEDLSDADADAALKLSTQLTGGACRR